MTIYGRNRLGRFFAACEVKCPERLRRRMASQSLAKMSISGGGLEGEDGAVLPITGVNQQMIGRHECSLMLKSINLCCFYCSSGFYYKKLDIIVGKTIEIRDISKDSKWKVTGSARMNLNKLLLN